MSPFWTNIELENPGQPGQRITAPALLVDRASMLSWVPAAVLESLSIQRFKRRRFRQSTGTIVERWVGAVRIHVAGRETIDEIVFGEPGDRSVVGDRTLRGLNVVVDPELQQFVDAGPMLAALAGASDVASGYLEMVTD